MNNYERWQLENKGNILASDGHHLLFEDEWLEFGNDADTFGEDAWIFNNENPY
jgi:hypothetical protein